MFSRTSRPPTRPLAASRIRGALWIVAIVAASVSACNFDGLMPDQGPNRKPLATPPTEPLVQLELGKPQDASLDCPAGRCNARYRVDVPEAGTLHLHLDPRFESDEAGLRVVLEDPFGAPLANEPARGEENIDLSRPVDRGPYVIFVQSIGGPVDFDVKATWKRGARAAEPATASQPAPTPVYQAGAKPGYGADAAYDPAIDFSKYRYYAFAEVPQERLEAPPGESVGNPFLEADIQRAVGLEFIDRGFILANSLAEADFLVSTHVGTRSTTYWALGLDNFQRNYRDYFNQWGGLGAPVNPHTYRKGTIVVDFIDVEKKALSWHGWSSESVSPIMDRRELIRQMVASILDGFPPAAPLR